MTESSIPVEVATLNERVANLIARYEKGREEDRTERTQDRAQLDRIEGQTLLTNGRVTKLDVRVEQLEQVAGGRQRAIRLRVDRLLNMGIAIGAAVVGALAAHFLGAGF